MIGKRAGYHGHPPWAPAVVRGHHRGRREGVLYRLLFGDADGGGLCAAAATAGAPRVRLPHQWQRICTNCVSAVDAVDPAQLFYCAARCWRRRFASLAAIAATRDFSQVTRLRLTGTA